MELTFSPVNVSMENLMKRMRTVTKEMAIPPYPMLIARLVSFACNEDFV